MEVQSGGNPERVDKKGVKSKMFDEASQAKLTEILGDGAKE
jgi:hypothetical protein